MSPKLEQILPKSEITFIGSQINVVQLNFENPVIQIPEIQIPEISKIRTFFRFQFY